MGSRRDREQAWIKLPIHNNNKKILEAMALTKPSYNKSLFKRV